MSLAENLRRRIGLIWSEQYISDNGLVNFCKGTLVEIRFRPRVTSDDFLSYDGWNMVFWMAFLMIAALHRWDLGMKNRTQYN